MSARRATDMFGENLQVTVGSTIRCRFPDFVSVACRFPRFMSVGTVLVGHWESAPDQRG